MRSALALAALLVASCTRAAEGGGGDASAGGGPSPVVISEIMYHPVKEDADEEWHEFVEIANRSKAVVSLAGWRLEAAKDALAFTFPADARIAPGEHKVIAKSKKALAAVARFSLTEAALYGDYKGSLDNGGTTLLLQDAAGNPVDAVKYDDRAPWPLAADALGVGDEWLPEAERPMEKHRYMGRSLERIDLDVVSTDAANWEASPLDGATPGKPNAVKGEVQPIAIAVGATPEGGDGAVIRKEQKIAIRARLSDHGKVDGVELRFFVDDLIKRDEQPTVMAMQFVAAEGVWQATLPGQPDNTIVRYQIWARRNDKDGRVSPRATDPLPWHSAFVTPTLSSTSRAYHLFIHPEDWSKLELWLSRGRAMGCEPNPDWDTEVPATFAYDGQVYDVRVRYSGSRSQRPNGFNLPADWDFSRPTIPPGRRFKALSWAIKFPRSQPFEGNTKINLNKMFQGCAGTISYVESRLLEKAGIPSYRVRFARLHVNGGYYHYMMEPEPIDEPMLSRYLEPGEVVGDLYKNDGAGGDTAAAARGDFRPIADDPAYCGGKYTLADRYNATYPRKTHEHRGPDALIKLITDLDVAARAESASQAVQAVKDYFTQNWDVDALARTFAVRNWSGVWDDTFHNVFPYKLPSSGRWILLQQDFEWDFGLGQFGGERKLSLWRPDTTLYIGAYSDQPIGLTCEVMMRPIDTMEGRRCNALGFSRLKDLFISNFRDTYDQSLRELSKTILDGEEVVKVIDEAARAFNLEDWTTAPADKGYCKPDQIHDAMRTWARERHAFVTSRLGM